MTIGVLVAIIAAVMPVHRRDPVGAVAARDCAALGDRPGGRLRRATLSAGRRRGDLLELAAWALVLTFALLPQHGAAVDLPDPRDRCAPSGTPWPTSIQRDRARRRAAGGGPRTRLPHRRLDGAPRDHHRPRRADGPDAAPRRRRTDRRVAHPVDRGAARRRCARRSCSSPARCSSSSAPRRARVSRRPSVRHPAPRGVPATALGIGAIAVVVAIVAAPLLPQPAIQPGGGDRGGPGHRRLPAARRRPAPPARDRRALASTPTLPTAPYLRAATLSRFDGAVWEPGSGALACR